MMPLSRLWLFLLTLLGGLLALCFLLSPAQVRRSLQGSAHSRMELAQQSATLLLANSARLWVDTAAQLASDAALQSSLEEQQRGQAEPELLHRSVQQHARKAAEALKLSFIIVTDVSGRVVARAGRDEGAWRDAIDGYPLVGDAVRGYRLDDIWLEGGVLYRMAAAPVIAPSRERYVGAVILGQAIGDDLAEQLRSAVGMDVVFLGAGRLLASSRPKDKVPGDLLQFAISNGALLQSGGHSPPISLSDGDEIAVLVGLPGEAASRGAALGLLSTGPTGASLRSVLANLAAAAAEGDLPLWQLPVVGGAIVLCFLLGLLLLRAEGEGPLQRVLGELREIGKRRAQKVEEGRYRGAFRELALSVNGALRAVQPLEGAAPISSLGELSPPAPRPTPIPQTTPGLSPAPAFAPTVPMNGEAPPPGSPFAPPSLPPAPAPGSARAGTPASSDTARASSRPTPRRSLSSVSPVRPTGIPLPAARTLPTEPLRSARPSGELAELEAEPASARTLLDPVLEAELEASQLSPAPDLPTVQDIPQSLVQAAIEQALGAAPAPFAGTPRSPSAGPYGRGSTSGVGPAPVRPTSFTPPPAAEIRLGAHHPPPDLTEEITAVNRTPPVPEEDELEASFRRTYQEFIVTKQRCHEPVEGLTYDKFVVKLKQSREQIMRQHNCRAVRFHVYVKDGKAALKATPVTR